MSKFKILHKLVRHIATSMSFTFALSVRETQNIESFVQFSGFAQLQQDEETGEQRELDKVIDNAAFNTIVYLIQKDSSYEAVIDFEQIGELGQL